MLQRLRESLALILIAVLPMHAILVTVATHTLEGQNHAPLAFLALWKESLLAFIMLIAFAELLRMKEPELKHAVMSLDLIDWCIIVVITFGVAVSIFGGAGLSFGWPLSLADKQFLLGFKYDFLPLVAFFVLRRVLWSRNFLVVVTRTIGMVGVVAAVFGIATLFLPLSFFTGIGYSDLHSLYLPNAPIASFQFLEGTDIRRIQSFMSGPNQFGLWLLLPISAHLQLLIKSLRERRRFDAMLYAVGEILVLIALFFTYSRSAWIGAAVILVTVSILLLKDVITSAFHRTCVLVTVGVFAVGVMLVGMWFSPQILVRTQSLKGHIEKPIAAMEIMGEHPLGLGLGTAGPASNHLSDTCVFLEAGADFSWATSRKDFCVFVGGEQKLPVGTACNCPLLTENWYLQWGVERGWAGVALSVMLVFFVFRSEKRKMNSEQWILLSFVGISVAALFLHAWEDAAVAYTLWLLLGAGGLCRMRQKLDV